MLTSNVAYALEFADLEILVLCWGARSLRPHHFCSFFACRFGRFTVTEPKKVPVNIWESVDKAQAGVLVCCLFSIALIVSCCLTRLMHWIHQDTLERSASLDASLKPFATVVSALHKGEFDILVCMSSNIESSPHYVS